MSELPNEGTENEIIPREYQVWICKCSIITMLILII